MNFFLSRSENRNFLVRTRLRRGLRRKSQNFVLLRSSRFLKKIKKLRGIPEFSFSQTIDFFYKISLLAVGPFARVFFSPRGKRKRRRRTRVLPAYLRLLTGAKFINLAMEGTSGESCAREILRVSRGASLANKRCRSELTYVFNRNRWRISSRFHRSKKKFVFPRKAATFTPFKRGSLVFNYYNQFFVKK